MSFVPGSRTPIFGLLVALPPLNHTISAEKSKWEGDRFKVSDGKSQWEGDRFKISAGKSQWEGDMINVFAGKNKWEGDINSST